MPYFWSRICNIYKDETPEGWDTSTNAILSDLAWFVIEDQSNPRALYQAVQDSYDKDEDFRPPYPDEDGLFKTWYDEILVSEASIGHRDSLMDTLFHGCWGELKTSEASYMVHMLPSETIIGFMENIKKRIQNEQDETTSIDTNEIQAHDEEDDYNSDNDSDNSDSDNSDSDDDSDNESEEEEEVELRTNQWARICHQWQYNITPRIYQEILRGTGGHTFGRGIRNYMNQFPLLDQSEPMDISDEDSDVEMRNDHTFYSQSIRV